MPIYYTNVGEGSTSDSLGNTYTSITSAAENNFMGTRLYYCSNPTVGSSVTWTTGAVGTYQGVYVAAFKGAASTSPLDQFNAVIGNGGTQTTNPGPITPTQNNELIVTGAGTAGGSALTINSGYTISDRNTYNPGVSWGGAMAYLIQTTASATNPTWSNTGQYPGVIASFKADNNLPVSRSYIIG